MINCSRKLLLLLLIYAMCYLQANAEGFVELPRIGKAGSAYVNCNTSGDFGRKVSTIPSLNDNHECAIVSNDINKSPISSPLEGFKLVGVHVSDVEMDVSKRGNNPVVAILSEAIWRNRENTECILATQLDMRDSPLINGQYFEINDIAHAGFKGKKVSVAYFHKSHSQEYGGNTEVLFRAARSFTSVSTEKNNQDLPSLVGAPPNHTVLSSQNTAGFNDNWVIFTTDIGFKDTDETTRSISSIFYIKYECDHRDPTFSPGVIHLRSTETENGKQPYEIVTSGLIPADGNVELF